MKRSLGLALVVAIAMAGLTIARTVAAGEVPPTSAFVSTPMQRVLDTRTGGADLAAGSTRRVTVSHVVPADATAVVANLTIVDSGGAGWAVLYDAVRSRPSASTINADSAGQTVANFAIVAIGPSRELELYTTVQSHFVLDISGYFRAAAASAAGRYESTYPRRAVDTRTRGLAPAADEFDVSLAGNYGLPESGVGAVAVVITATNTIEPGWVQLGASRDTASRGQTSTLNVSRRGQSISNLAIVDLDGGDLRVLSTASAHLIIDVLGWFTDESAMASDDGLFVAMPGTRLIDTRGRTPLEPKTSIPIGIPESQGGWVAKAAVINMTAIDSAGAGYFTAFPHEPRPPTSNLNLDHPNQTLPAGALTSLDDKASFLIFTSVATHLAVDLNGVFVRRAPTTFPTTTTTSSTTTTSTTTTSTTTTNTTTTTTTTTTTSTTTTSSTTTRPPQVGEHRCTVSLHGKGGSGSPTWTGSDGVSHIYPQGNASGWGGRQWLYYPESGYVAARSEVSSGVAAAGCTRTIIYGFSNGASFAAKLYCRGETFGGTVIGYVIDDPVVDQAVLGCAGVDGQRKSLYWTNDINIPDGWDCVSADWTCEGGTAIGIERYEQALGLTRTPSIWPSHRPYDPPPEFSEWW